MMLFNFSKKLFVAICVAISFTACNEASQNSNDDGLFSIDLDESQNHARLLEETLKAIIALDMGCESASDCMVVSGDLNCNHEYLGINSSNQSQYDDLVETLMDFRERHEILIACNMWWSETQDIHNYEAVCFENRCRAEFNGEFSGF